MLVGFFSTVDDKMPTMTNMYSLIKQNPGMGYRPNPNKETTLIKYSTYDNKTYKDKVDDLLNFLTENNYTDKIDDSTYAPSKIVKDAAGNDTFNMEDFGEGFQKECGIVNGSIYDSFGYKEGKPCVLLKINRVFYWNPQPFDVAEINKTQDDTFGHEALKALGDRQSSDHIGVSCEGENDGDVDNLGEVKFFPKLGFAFKYYPYENAKDYRAPLVFAKFSNIEPGAIVQVWCKLWVRNIKHHKNDKAGSVHFEVLVDKPRPERPESTTTSA